MAMTDGLLPLGENVSGTARLLALPNLAMFPHSTQIAHLSRPSDCTLVQEAVESDRLLAVAILAAGWQQQGNCQPPVRPVACLAQVTAEHRLADGSWNVLLSGLYRLRLLHELPPIKPFREARAEILEDRGSKDDAVNRVLRRKLRDTMIAVFSRFVPSSIHAWTGQQLPHPLASTILAGIHHAKLGLVADQIAAMLDLGMERKAALLAESHVTQRVEMLIESLEFALRDDTPGAAGAHFFPPVCSPN